MSTQLVTPIAILSYPNLLKPQKAEKPGDKEKYSACLVFPAGTDLTAMRAAAIEAAIAKFGSEVTIGKKKFKTAEACEKGLLKLPFRTDVEAKSYPDGSTFFNARSERKPGVVYSHAEPGTTKPARVPDSALELDLYPGCMVRASVTFFGYDVSGNVGVGVGLNNVQKVGEGERLDNRVAAENEFTADLDAAPADLASLK